jgi:hypothetical protein
MGRRLLNVYRVGRDECVGCSVELPARIPYNGGFAVSLCWAGVLYCFYPNFCGFSLL